MVKKKRKPAETPEARENQLIKLAVDLAEEQLASGKASTQVIVHYLKLASTRENLEKELVAEKIEAMKSAQRIEQLYEEAINAMKLYSGNREEYDEEL